MAIRCHSCDPGTETRVLIRLVLSGLIFSSVACGQEASPCAVAQSNPTATRSAGEYEWVAVNRQAEFAPRDGAGLLSFQNRLWLLGGWNPGDKDHFPRICNNEVWSSADGAAWVLEKPNSFLSADFDPSRDWEGRHTAGYAVFCDKLWIIGGGSLLSRHLEFARWCPLGARRAARALLDSSWHDRRSSRVPGPDLDPGRRHVRYAADTAAKVLQ